MCLKKVTSLVALVKTLPAVQTRVRSLGQEDPLEKVMATHSSILTWRIPSVEKPSGLQSMESQKVRYKNPVLLLRNFLLQLH